MYGLGKSTGITIKTQAQSNSFCPILDSSPILGTLASVNFYLNDHYHATFCVQEDDKTSTELKIFSIWGNVPL